MWVSEISKSFARKLDFKKEEEFSHFSATGCAEHIFRYTTPFN